MPLLKYQSSNFFFFCQVRNINICKQKNDMKILGHEILRSKSKICTVVISDVPKMQRCDSKQHEQYTPDRQITKDSGRHNSTSPISAAT